MEQLQNICAKFWFFNSHSHIQDEVFLTPTNSCWEISVWIKVLDGPTNRLHHQLLVLLKMYQGLDTELNVSFSISDHCSSPLTSLIFSAHNCVPVTNGHLVLSATLCLVCLFSAVFHSAEVCWACRLFFNNALLYVCPHRSSNSATLCSQAANEH